MDALPTITQLSDDFSNQNAPFDGAELPEQTALESVPDYHELPVLAYGVMLDYNRSADQLWDNILELYKEAPEYFDPERAASADLDKMQQNFEEIGFRYHHRDAEGWQDNSQILVDNFRGSWAKLLDHASFDALRLQRVIEDYGFKYLKGDKLCPFFIKVVHMNIVELERVWQLPIPVDVHIRRLSKELFADQLIAKETKMNEDDFIRSVWREVAEEHDIEPMVADTALWLIGNKWDEWGETYWEKL